MSSAGWDEDNCIITLDHDAYTGYVEKHKNDAELLNKPIEHYREMATIFDGSLATGKYAKGSGDPLGTEVLDVEEDEAENGGNGTADTDKDGTQSNNVGESSLTPKPAKRARSVPIDEDSGLQATLMCGFDRLATAIEKVAKDDISIPPKDFWQGMKSLQAGFNDVHLVHYYAYLCEKPSIAWAFYGFDVSDKLVWIARYVSQHFRG